MRIAADSYVKSSLQQQHRGCDVPIGYQLANVEPCVLSRKLDNMTNRIVSDQKT